MLELQAKMGGKSSTLHVEATDTVETLHAAIRSAFELGKGCGHLRVLAKGKAVPAELSTPLSSVAGLATGAKLMVMVTRAAEAAAVDAAPRTRMRGFEDDDARQRTGATGATGGGSSGVYRTQASGPTYKFHATAPLPELPPGVTPPIAAAEARLKELATDPGILAIMKRHKWNVGMLREMPPEGQVE